MKKIDSLEYGTFIWFIIRSCFVVTTSGILLLNCQEDAWICIILGIILGLFPSFIYNKIKKKFPDDNIFQINENVFKSFGKLINLIISLSVLLLGILIFWILITFITTQFLYTTPPFIVGIFLITPIIYINTKNLKTIGRVSIFCFYITVTFAIIIIAGLFKEINIDNLKPFLYHTPGNIIYSTLIFICYSILPLFLLTVIPKNKIKNYKTKTNFLFYLLGTLSLLNLMFFNITIFGINLATLYEYSSFHLLKRVDIFEIIDRIETILTIEWILGLIIILSLIVYFLKKYYTQISKKENKKKENIFIILSSLIILIISSFIFKTHGSSTIFFKGPSLIIYFITFLIIPFITLIKSFHIQNNPC